MEVERAFTREARELAEDNEKIAFKYSLGGGYKSSIGWEPLGPAGFYDTFGPELSFGRTLQGKVSGNIAIAKFTHSGSQMNDWTPKGTSATERNLYPQFIAFIRESIAELQAKGHTVELAGIFYHVGENDMSFFPYRKDAAKWLQSTIAKSREDLAMPALMWFVSQQPPTVEKGLNRIDVTASLAALAAADPAFIHIKAFDLPPQDEKLVITTAGIVELGEVLAQNYLEPKKQHETHRPSRRAACGLRHNPRSGQAGRSFLPSPTTCATRSADADVRLQRRRTPTGLPRAVCGSTVRSSAHDRAGSEQSDCPCANAGLRLSNIRHPWLVFGMRRIFLALFAMGLGWFASGAPVEPNSVPRRDLLPGEPAAADFNRARAMLEEWESTTPEKAPRVLRIFYWSPADRDPQPEYRARLTRVMRHIQNFYSREMAAWGFPGRTIRIELATDSLLTIHEVKGRLKSAECSETDLKDGEEIRRDCVQAARAVGIDCDKETIVIFCNLAEWNPETRTMSHHSPYYASGDSCGGTAWQVDSPLLDSALLGVKDQHITDGQYGRISLGKYNSFFVGGVCHELGHALGLPHCKESAACRAVRGTALMGGGNRTYGDELRGEGRGSFLTLPHALKLAAHPQFSGSVKEIAKTASAEFSDWDFEPDADGLRVRGRVTASLPAFAVIAYADPDGGQDYDSEVAAGVTARDGTFSFHISRPEKRDCFASLRFVAVCVNGAATSGNWAANALSLRCRIGADAAYDIAPAREQLELRSNTAPFLKGALSEAQIAKLTPRVQSALLRLKNPDSAEGKPTPAAVPNSTGGIPLSDTAPVSAKTGWGGVHFDRNNEGQPLEGPHGLFTHGLYAHADSLYEYQLEEKWDALAGSACVLDGGFGTVDALIEADGRTVWGPKLLKPGDQTTFEIDVKGVKKLALRMTGKDGNRGAWSAWGEPRLTRSADGKTR